MKIDWPAALGKGPGFVLFALVATFGIFVLSWCGKDVAALTGPLGVVCGALYAGGAAKAVGETWANGRKTGGT